MSDELQPTYIDVREPSEFAAGHVEGAINIPVGEIAQGVAMLSAIGKDCKIVVYCRSGIRAENAQKQLVELGYRDVTNGINQETISKNKLLNK